MAQLSVGYEGLVHDLSVPLIAAEVGKVLIGAVGDRYERMYPDCSLVQFTQSEATYLFALPSAVSAGRRKPGFSGCWCHAHVEGEGFGVGVVVPGVTPGRTR